MMALRSYYVSKLPDVVQTLHQGVFYRPLFRSRLGDLPYVREKTEMK